MKAKYYNKPEDVLFYDPIIRLVAKIIGPSKVVRRCKTCGKIPTELYGGYCFDHELSRH
jgi:hypothetical protein